LRPRQRLRWWTSACWLRPFEQRRPGFTLSRRLKASDLDFLPRGQFEISTSKRLSSVQAFSETRSAYYAVC
jgi:hypothetical protein